MRKVLLLPLLLELFIKNESVRAKNLIGNKDLSGLSPG